ncbi:MAG TPA: VOC family protein [Gemmatimonadaceae bacterium]|nr:VOC family protein [Gemmatimonadaceae bacterium]
MTKGIHPRPDSSAIRGPTTESAPRLPAALRLGQVRLQVGDLTRSLAYYTGVLGLHVTDRSEYSATLAAADGAPLVELVMEPGTRAIQPHGRLGLYHFALLLPDRAALGRFLAHLAETGTRIGASDHLVSEAIYLRDPDGLGIEVYADRPRSTWRHVNGQIEMATAPLDAESLLAAAGEERWSGMPAGTVMGHLHLHVADIDEAARFYHEALGLDRMVWSYPGALFLSAGGYHHHLGLNTWAGAHAAAPAEDEARLLHWRIVLPSIADARDAAARLSARGHAVIATADELVVHDPWGTRLVLAGA